MLCLDVQILYCCCVPFIYCVLYYLFAFRVLLPITIKEEEAEEEEEEDEEVEKG